MRTIYISGPMSGLPDYNYPAFANAKRFLEQDKENTIKSPHLAPKQSCWKAYMIFNIKLLLECDTIVMLPGWEKSKGAQIEKKIAEALGFPVLYYNEIEMEF